MEALIRSMMQRLTDLKRGLQDFTPEQRAGGSNLALIEKGKIEVLRDQLRNAERHLESQKDEIERLIAELHAFRAEDLAGLSIRQ